MRQAIRTVVLLGVTVGASFPRGSAASDSEVTYRPELALSGPVAEGLRWTWGVEPYITSDVQRAGETSLIAGLSWRATDHLTVAPSFKYVSKGADADSNESRPRIAAEVAGKAGPFKVALRNRFEYRMKEGRDDYWRYRARVKITFPKIGNVKPFIYEEVFHEFGDADELNGNEAGLGVGIPLADRLSMTVDVRLCHSKSGGEWGTGDVELLTVIKYSF